jgi:long-chain acyl-CoA synthetase
MKENTFLGIVEQSIQKNWELPAMTDFEGTTFYYKDFAKEINKLHDYFKVAGIKKGDKISLVGRNSARWAISFFATLSYGAVAVSILHEFDKDSVKYIVNHSDSVMLFSDESIWEELDKEALTETKTVFSLDNFSVLKSSSVKMTDFAKNAESFFEEKYKNGFSASEMFFHTESPEEVAILNYTSGTTSNPKGVMIPYRSAWSNTRFALDALDFFEPADGMVCMLPMAHTYGLTFEMLRSIGQGQHIYFLSKVPSPQILIGMLAKVKPKLVLAVPLIIEKIITKRVFPKLQKGAPAIMLKIPGLRNVVYKKVRKTLIDVFGGEVLQVVVGGAALNQDVEDFLRKIKFPYTVGYGMTECGPLISYTWWEQFKQKSVGRVVHRMQVRIDSDDPENIVGEIQVTGTNLMLGYYKNEEATKEVMLEDGWLKTGDLGVIDSDGFIYIKGRNKNMILGASGQNIYPEDIEDKINNYPFVMESLAVEREGKIIALIVPDTEVLAQLNVEKDNYPDFFDKWLKDINTKLPVYSKIASYQIREEEFSKTPKRSIKRFKYQ